MTKVVVLSRSCCMRLRSGQESGDGRLPLPRGVMNTVAHQDAAFHSLSQQGSSLVASDLMALAERHRFDWTTIGERRNLVERDEQSGLSRSTVCSQE